MAEEDRGCGGKREKKVMLHNTEHNFFVYPPDKGIIFLFPTQKARDKKKREVTVGRLPFVLVMRYCVKMTS
jgi:hypothetical protein